VISDYDPMSEAPYSDPVEHPVHYDRGECPHCGNPIETRSVIEDMPYFRGAAMSDPLAERIYQAAFDRHVLIDRTDCAALASAARAFIADEIAARYKDEKAKYPGWDTFSSGFLYAFDIAEQIARGDQP
jgi:hypothetical protein